MSFSACSASTGSGSGSWEGNQVSTNGIRSPWLERELGDGRHVLAVHLDRRAEAERVGPGDRDARVVDAAHPGHDVAVVEADHELRAHRHAPVEPLDDPHDVRRRRRAAA